MKLAIQGAISASIVLAIGSSFSLVRPFWGVLTAMAVLCQTWGENIRKAVQALIGTVMGAGIAILFVTAFPHYLTIEILALGLCIFMFVYSAPVSYGRSMFWIVIMLVILFSFSGNKHMAWVRIYQTLIGALTGIAVSALVFPIRAEHKAKKDFPLYLNLLRENCNHAFDNLLAEDSSQLTNLQGRKILTEYNTMQGWYKALSYEAVFGSTSRKRIKNLMVVLMSLSRYVTGLIESIEQGHNIKLISIIQDELITARKYLDEEFSYAISLMQNKNSSIAEFVRMEDLKNQVREKIRPLITADIAYRHELILILPIFYYTMTIHYTLKDFTERVELMDSQLFAHYKPKELSN